MGFGKKLKKLREERNLTQQDLANMIEVSSKTISRYYLSSGIAPISIINSK